METETWRPVPGWETLYEVSDIGRVRSLPRRAAPGNRLYEGRVLGGVWRKGYRHVTLCRSGTPQTRVLVHHLVLMAFVGPRPTGLEGRHLNDIPSDNRLANLAWGTRSENMADAVANGRHRNAEKTHCPANHEYTPENTRIEKTASGGPARRCLTCQRELEARRVRH